ncbi:heme exporter protein CcmB [Limoniibacter endophyticus]|uniref:Heme exporter protein B n=1 Tax=Limoniibacter endophyticus TaxID=1565040 RepID=A0A8J3GIU9_9HYPH|nr:heme exporter protein CcmB [Limoniibacter endophyticus]GHC74246.1 heme exporter protein B [Limoniibacter endophyticus]
MKALLRRELLNAFSGGGATMVALLFFLSVVSVLPFAVGPDMTLLARLGPAILWIGALLAGLLGLERLFQEDRQDGSLDLLRLNTGFLDLTMTVFVKSLAHWLSHLLPLAFVAPALGLLMNMEAKTALFTALTLIMGTPAIAFIGAVGAGVAVALPRAGLLVSVLILPVLIPALIFGVSASYAAQEGGANFAQPLLLLIAVNLFAAVLGPVATALSLSLVED